jgi:glycyl-tRNA synthetase
MEMEYFIDPEDDSGSCPFYERRANTRLRLLPWPRKKEGGEPEWYVLSEAVEEGVIVHKCLGYWMAVAQDFIESLGVPRDEIYFEEKGPHERAHYSSQTYDQLVRVSRWGWVEVSGHSYRGDYDLSRHMKYSGADLTVFKPYEKPRIEEREEYLVDRAFIGKMFKERAKEIFKALQDMSQDLLREAAEQGKHLQVAGYKIPPEAIIKVKRKIKVSGRKFVPHVVEPSFGVERVLYVTFEHAYRVKEGRVVLSLPRDIAPVQAVVLPLIEKDESLRKVAREVYDILRVNGFYAVYDDSGSIGRRYARYDEIGVPAAVTIDYQTLEDNTVTVRDRDSWRQVRVPLKALVTALRRFIYEGASLDELGEPLTGDER